MASASISRTTFCGVCPDQFGADFWRDADLDAVHAVLKATIAGDVHEIAGEHTGGVWRIRQAAGSPHVEVFKVEDSGTGGIISNEWKTWRETRDLIKTASEQQSDQLKF